MIKGQPRYMSRLALWITALAKLLRSKRDRHASECLATTSLGKRLGLAAKRPVAVMVNAIYTYCSISIIYIYIHSYKYIHIYTILFNFHQSYITLSIYTLIYIQWSFVKYIYTYDICVCVCLCALYTACLDVCSLYKLEDVKINYSAIQSLMLSQPREG